MEYFVLKIGIDVDETVRQFKKRYIEIYNTDPDVVYYKNHQHDPNLSKELLLNALPFPGAQEFVKFIRFNLPKIIEEKTGKKIKIQIYWISAQASKLNSIDTLLWLNKYRFYYPNDIYKTTPNKGQVPIHILIDDKDEYLETLKPNQIGIKTKFKETNLGRTVDYEAIKKELIEKAVKIVQENQ